MTTLANSIPAKLILIKLALFFITLALPVSVMSFPDFPRKELPLCPGGGPSGWLNYFDYKRDQNIRRRYPRFQSPYLQSYYQRPPPFGPTYYGPYAFRPYTNAPHSYARDYTYQLPPAIK